MSFKSRYSFTRACKGRARIMVWVMQDKTNKIDASVQFGVVFSHYMVHCYIVLRLYAAMLHGFCVFLSERDKKDAKDPREATPLSDVLALC